MKFSYNWLRELTGTGASAEELGRLITMKTAESEGVEEYAPLLARAEAVTVVSAEPIAGTHNQRCVITGDRTVVCGAPNCRSGMHTVWLDIGRKIINGIESNGMLASGVELGVNRDHSGIVELSEPKFDLEPDWVVEIDNKSLTHRPDLWGHYGMAREVAALTGATLRDPVKPRDISAPPAIQVVIEDYDLCPRYSALVFENVTVQPSPLWLQYRLEAIGLNPINNIVDVSNLLMAELAQPTHAFDADKIGSTIIVRRAREGERILALNDEWYDLTPANLLITDASGPIAIGGVIGGGPSSISAGTRRIVLESANFKAASIRRTSTALKLRTDASMRFEKSQDPLNTVRALYRAIELFEAVSPGIRLVGGLADAWLPKPAPAPIEVGVEWLNMKLGVPVTAAEATRYLENLGFGVEQQPGSLRVTVPSWRATKDVSIREDIAEEIGRMIGYVNIPPVPPMVPTSVPPHNEERAFHHQLRSLMSDLGFDEVYNYSFISDALAARWGEDALQHVRLANPIAEDQNLMRTSLLPLIGRNIEENAKHFDHFRLFEIGNEIHVVADAPLPDEVPHLVAVIYSKHGDGAANLFELKRTAECLHEGAEVRLTKALPHEHPARAAEIPGLGRLFELHPSYCETGRAAILDIDLRELFARRPKGVKYTPVRRYPTSAFDLSIVIPARQPAGEIESQIRECASNLVSVEFLREYAGPPLAEGTRSVSYRVTIGAADRTLSSDEITASRAALIEALRARKLDLRV